MAGAGWSSLVARRAHNPKVVGSNPAPATRYSKKATQSSGLFVCAPFKDSSPARPWSLRPDLTRGKSSFTASTLIRETHLGYDRQPHGQGDAQRWSIASATARIGAAGWSSLVARRAHNPKVVGSNPAPATRYSERPLNRVAFLHLRPTDLSY